jgi:mannose-1-phosphate guanylyltransferase/mannose-1-phosphate guanylyltransferase/mannose-6-phosphate isomerase
MIPFVLSGGSGTRLWPVSRESLPKHLCDLFDESLLAKTVRRLRSLAPGGGGAREVGVVGAASSEALTRRVLRDAGVSGRWALFEPRGRNTAPAVALVCHRLLQAGLGGEVVGIFPADHLVADEETFRRAVALAERVARGDGSEPGPVVTLGIEPSGPDTGYGYIETAGEPVARESDLAALPVRAFHEKPDAATAERYVDAGGYYWNAGMFVFRADVMAGAFERLMPELWRAIRTVEPDLSNLAEVYEAIEPESLDYGIMEHLSGQVTIPVDPGWSDVGSWDEMARLSRDPGTSAVAEVGGTGNFVHTHRRRVYGLVGVEDLLVVDTEDALLIARRGRSQEVREVVGRLREAGHAQASEHAFDVRPWGRYDVLRDEADFKSKTIRVDPGQRLSYQSHRHRAEHWVIVRGRPRVVIDDRALDLGPGDHVFIPRGAKHRISNPGEEAVLFVEVQIGDYFGEDDIVRYEDDYDRA